MPRPRHNARKEVRVDMCAFSNREAEELIGSYRKLVGQIAGDHPEHDADELCAVGYVAVLEAAITHNPARIPLPQWVAKTVRWRIGEVASREGARLDKPRMQEAPEPVTNGIHDPERRFMLDQILEMLPYLPPQQAVIIAGRLRRETFEEIASTMGITFQWAHEEYTTGVAQVRTWIQFGVT